VIIFLKKILNFIIFNPALYKYSKNYITTDKLLSNKLSQTSYLRFLIKNLIKNKIKLKKFKFIYIYLFTLIYQLSANCWNSKYQIVISNKINEFNLKELIKKLNYLLPTGFLIKIIEKKKIFILNQKKISNKIFKILLTNNESVFIKNKENKSYNYIILYTNDFRFKIFKRDIVKEKLQNNLLNSSQRKKKFILLKKLGSNLITQKEFSKKNYFIFFYKKFIYKKFNSQFIKKIKFRFYSKNISKISILQNIVLRYHGLIFVDNRIIKESLENSWYDQNFYKDESVLNYKIHRNVDFQCIVLSTGTNNLAHYLFESIVKLQYVKTNQNIKVIINNKISEDIVKILLAYGIKNNQILKKPILENWKIKELVFPALSYFEISKDECNFLSKIVKKHTSLVPIRYDKIYISRRDSTDSRNLINEIEIEDYLKVKGYKIILMSKLSLSKKIEIFTNAKIIITPLGAGIQNVYFCKKVNAKVILIGTRRYFHQKYFLQLSYFKKINLFFIPCVELTSYTHDFGYLHSSFYLDLEILKEALSRVNNY
jgi:hypothetical protein